jgi:hypothetical protein
MTFLAMAAYPVSVLIGGICIRFGRFVVSFEIPAFFHKVWESVS